MAREIITDELWVLIEPLLPPAKPRRFRYPGRKPVDNRRALTGIIFVLRTGIPWEDLPKEMGCGCGMTCWRRLRDWQEAGVWDDIHQMLLNKLHAADKLDWSRAAADSSSVRAVFGGTRSVRIPRIAARAERNTTSSSMGMARRWPRQSPVPMPLTSRN
jgi:transposase